MLRLPVLRAARKAAQLPQPVRKEKKHKLVTLNEPGPDLKAE
jgi:hypothetical protein